MLDKITILGLNITLDPLRLRFSLMNSFISSMALGSSPMAARISRKLVIFLSVDSHLSSVMKLAACGER